MATAVVVPTPTQTPGWQQETTSICEKVLVENEKENSKDESPMQDNNNNQKIEEKSRPKVEPITDWQRKQFESWMEQNGSNMYPSRDEKEKLAEMLDASYPQITRLFANHRRRFLKKKPTTPQTEIKEGSIERLMAIIKEPSSDNLVHDETSTSERSVSPTLRFDDGASETDDSLAAICGAVADQIHDDIENKQKNLNQNDIQKKKRKPKKRKISDREAKLEATVDEILSKISKEDFDVEKIKKEDNCSLTDSQDQSMTSAVVDSASVSNLTDMNDNHLLSLVNEVIAKPPTAIPQSVMADVNPRLLEAMDLLNKGVSWTHPAILSVLLEILRQQQEQQARLNIISQLSQQQNYNVYNVPETSPPPASESVNSGISEKSTEELMRSLTPDEYLAVNVLTELADC